MLGAMDVEQLAEGAARVGRGQPGVLDHARPQPARARRRAGRGHPARRHRARRRAVRHRLDARQRDRPGPGRRRPHVRLARRPVRRARAHRRDSRHAQPLGLGARVRHRQRRLLREGRVQPGLGVRRQADRPRARPCRAAARRQLERPAQRVAAGRRDGARGRLGRRSAGLMDRSTISVGFDFIDRRVMAAVERVASSDPNPADPFRGLYISDDRALELSRGDSVSDADDRLAHVTAALGLDLLDAAVLAICAAPELNPRYGRLYAYLQDDVTRKLPSPRLVGHLLSGEGVSAAEVMMAFERDAPLRTKGAIRLQGDAQTPLAERPIKLSDRLAAHLLGVGMDDPPAGGRLRLVPLPDHDPGRDEAVAALAATLAHPSNLPVVLAGPDAEALVAKAYGRALVVAHIREIDVVDTMAEAALIAALEDRPLVFEGLEDVEPGERARLLRAIERRGERVVVCAPNRNAALALGDRTSLLIEAAPPGFAERRSAWEQASGA